MGNGIELHVVGDMRASNGKSLNPRSFEIVDALRIPLHRKFIYMEFAAIVFDGNVLFGPI